jgi:hypothetical protein
VTTPNDALHGSYLTAAAEVGPNDVWAGGYYSSDSGVPVSLPFFEHWNGTAWSVVAATLPAGGVSGQIWDMAVNSSNDVWAVGNYSDGSNSFELIERWNGLQWSTVAGANPSPTDNELHGVVVVSANNVWAVGAYTPADVGKTLVEHWDGAAWTQVTSPNLGTGDNALQDVSIVQGSSGHDIWAAGDYSPTPGATRQTLTLHYDGTTWGAITSPNQGAGDNVLNGVRAISSGDVWAVGSYTTGAIVYTLAEHWNGSAWSIAQTIDPGSVNLFSMVYATAGNNVWAAGYSTSGSTQAPLIEHWNGSAWSISMNAPVGSSGTTEGITGGSSGDLWAVGSYAATSIAPPGALAEHYNGTTWSPVYAPNAPANNEILYAESALSANDVWAVGFSLGYIQGTTQGNRALIEHWNGSSWSIATIPHPGTPGDQLLSVKAVSSSDVWAVGDYKNATNFQTLILHWNGSTWSQITSPNPAGDAHDHVLVGVDATSANDVWAVGYYHNDTASQTLIVHWNGSAWVQFTSPSPGANANELHGVTVVPGSGGNDAWAVGYYRDNPGDNYSTLFERWNGTTWSVVPGAGAAGVDNEPGRIFALSPNDAWAVGYTYDGGSAFQNLVLHWNGTAWSLSPIVQQGQYGDQLFGGTALAPNDVYVVGGYINASHQAQSLIEHWNGSTWSVVPSVPTPGNGAVLADIKAISSSNIWAVGGYTPTGFSPGQTMAQHYFPCLASCSISFSDVPLGSTFYPWIHCLACLGIINGYPDGTFKPNANVTRGQFSKIVSNSAGFSDAQPNRMFQDVPVGSTFQVFIGRLASRGYISGYACGGAGEPCGPANLPYFRPNNNATRGQISKIDSNAAGYSDTPSGQQFQDVPVGSAFYAYTYRLVSRNIMSGYPCGGAGEPCGPGNLPYFRPNNNATRGQTSKIVAGTFFPDCSLLGALKP